MRRLVGATGWFWVSLLWPQDGRTQTERLPPGLEARSTRAGGGCLEVGHRVLGVPWGELSWSRWNAADGSKQLEWARGLSLEGGPRWSKVHAFWGGMRQWDGGLAMWQVSAGLTSWPALAIRTPWLACRASASRDAPWGNLRMEAAWTPGQWMSSSQPEDAVARAELPWTWTAWWTPNLEGTAVGLPAVGWSQDGQWALAWNAQVRWAEALRFWRPPPGKIHLHWRLPAHVFEVAWKGSLATSARSQNPKTFARGNPSSAPRQAMGCAMRQGQDLPGWRAFWMWQREAVAQEQP